MKYKVSYTASAKRDIRGIYEYISNNLLESGKQRMILSNKNAGQFERFLFSASVFRVS